jgi:arginine-tRNA-protein transferase
MKLFYSEYKAVYDDYKFPYQVFLKKEDGDSIKDILNMGFLPTRFSKNIFYLCRSLRIDLTKFELSSENRRIQNKTEEFSCELIDLEKFDYSNEVQKNCKDWFNTRFEKKIISAQGVKKVFTEDNNNKVFVWSHNSKEVGFVPCIENDDLIYYNFAFYNPDFYKLNLGARMMLQAVLYAKEKGKKYIYLGSIYTKGSLYKTEFSGFEFFNGMNWSSDKAELKYLIDYVADDYLLRDENYRKTFLRIEKLSDI